jgi:hypothetical protein
MIRVIRQLNKSLAATSRRASPAHTVFQSSNTRIVSSNPTEGLVAYPRFSVFVLSCVGRGLVIYKFPV